MRLYIKQRVFSWNDRFTIKDADGVDRYFVEGELFSWGHKLHVYDAQNREVAFVKQQVFTFMPKFEVYVGGALAVEVIKKISFFRPQYFLNGTDWQVDGDFWSHSYVITSGSYNIANISKVWFSWGDSYELDIAPGVNEIMVVATVLAIDCVLEAEHN